MRSGARRTKSPRERMNGDGDGNLSIEEVQEVAAKQVTQSYAGAASKPVVDMNNLLYVQKGQERREPIPKALFTAFMQRLQHNLWFG